ncbi:MAG: hypothetical protein ACIAS6_12075 [Phycisphaerales bacterium JB060]
MSDFMTNLKYRLEPIQEKLGMGDKPIGKIALYTVVILLGFGVLLWAVLPDSTPLVSEPRIPVASSGDSGSDGDSPASTRPPKETGGSSRAAPGMPGG